MSISGQYPQPVIVNGYVCWNCNQVSEAKKDINPASQTQGADGASSASSNSDSAYILGGNLTQPSVTNNQAAGATTAAAPSVNAPAAALNIIV